MKQNERIKLAASILALLSGLFALGAISDVVPAAYHKWVALAVAVTAYIGHGLESLIPARSGSANVPPAAVALLALCIAAAPACGPTTWQGAVIRTADVMREATAKTIPDMMSTALTKERAACLKLPDASRRPCLERIKRILESWVVARGALNTTIQTMADLYKNFPAKPKPAPAPAAMAKP